MSADHPVSDLVRIRLEPLAVELDVPRGSSLVAALAARGVEFPCGGTGECGGCGVRLLSGSLPAAEADSGVFTAEQLASGWRLACQARALSPLVLECAQWHMQILSHAEVVPSFPAVSSRERVGVQSTSPRGLTIAIDLGTTTIAAQLIAPAGGVLAVETALNPQAAFGSDVMSRIRAALDGHDLTDIDLTTPIRASLGQLVARLAPSRRDQINEVLLVGNTVMHHLFCDLSVEPLSHVPFESPHLAEQRFAPRDLSWDLPSACTIRFARCIGGFVGSDILAGIVASGIAHGPQLSALVDLGTNGEIAIGNRNGIVCASTAAGPAFEAGSIRMGMRAVTGAVAYVSRSDGTLHATVIGDVEPRGICGSGLVDAVAAGLNTGHLLANGRVANGAKLFSVVPPVVLYQSDIRELQLAKGAIAAGFRLLLKRLGASSRDVSAIYLAGAFGNYVQINSAIRIGLLEAPHSVIHAAGNTALRGARMLLLTGSEPELPPIEHVSLAADPGFQDEFANCMAFPEYDKIRMEIRS
ncbi:MAG: ASKHA domain-containing protein [Terracidiphilus sp.]